MEEILQYAWKHKIFDVSNLLTTTGTPFETFDTGIHNTNEGPDFFNAKIKYNCTVWACNAETHCLPSV